MQPLSLTLVYLLGAAAVIYFACEYFVNGVEWVGHKLAMGQKALLKVRDNHSVSNVRSPSLSDGSSGSASSNASTSASGSAAGGAGAVVRTWQSTASSSTSAS